METDKREEMFQRIHYGMYAFNGIVVFLLAGFMGLTQEKIICNLSARYFLEPLNAVPWPSQQIFAAAAASFLALFGTSWMYRNVNVRFWMCRYALLSFEIVFCIAVMRSVQMAYDGVILLVVADLVRGYEGRKQRILLTAAMLVLYLAANYNLAAWQMDLVPLEAYFSYYTLTAQGVFKAVINSFTSLNLIFFVLYMIRMVQSQHMEKERIRLLNEQLNAANEKLRLYAMEAESVAETRERNRLAREIHDTLGHALTGILAGLDMCIAMVDTAPAFTKRQLEKIREVANHGMKDVRRSVKKLRPDDLERRPLSEAISIMIAEFAASTGMEIRLEGVENLKYLQKDEAEAAYRIVQEGMTNANRHGHATEIAISIHLSSDALHICLQDNGRGCGDIRPGFGLRHMQERIALLKGVLTYESAQGFRLEAVIPTRRGGRSDDQSHGR